MTLSLFYLVTWVRTTTQIQVIHYYQQVIHYLSYGLVSPIMSVILFVFPMFFVLLFAESRPFAQIPRWLPVVSRVSTTGLSPASTCLGVCSVQGAGRKGSLPTLLVAAPLCASDLPRVSSSVLLLPTCYLVPLAGHRAAACCCRGWWFLRVTSRGRTMSSARKFCAWDVTTRQNSFFIAISGVG